MKERPILFNAEMVRAILDGRKTQTRRPVKPQPDMEIDGETCPDGSGGWSWVPVWPEGHKWSGRTLGWAGCPLGRPGDRLWVRETWAHDAPSLEECRARLEDGLAGGLPYGPYYRTDSVHEGTGLRWRPSIHMPRWASRILLEITAVRVERVQDITLESARAEGITEYLSEFLPSQCTEAEDDGWRNRTSIENYRHLWESLYGPLAWAINPWVWVIEFRRIVA